ncbi:hypothetical protein NC651_014826 [Populus alba x Populus x berolinensis]|nr:hypothetical protein NC651_014826 [Populus alba x Populus x berolinensis]
MLYVTRYINDVLALILLSINDGDPKVSVSRKDPSVNSKKTEIVGNIKECIELSKLDDHRGHDSQYAGTSLEATPIILPHDQELVNVAESRQDLGKLVNVETQSREIPLKGLKSPLNVYALKHGYIYTRDEYIHPKLNAKLLEKRRNLMVTSTLHPTVCNPIRSISIRWNAKKWAPLPPLIIGTFFWPHARAVRSGVCGGYCHVVVHGNRAREESQDSLKRHMQGQEARKIKIEGERKKAGLV